MMKVKNKELLAALLNLMEISKLVVLYHDFYLILPFLYGTSLHVHTPHKHSA